MDSTVDPATLLSQLPDQGSLAGNVLKTKESFGDITLVAVFEAAYTDLVITKTAVNGATFAEDQGFVFVISGQPSDGSVTVNDLTVAINGAGSVTIKDIPVGEYTITEKIDWSWRYIVSAVTLAAENEPATTLFSTGTTVPEYLKVKLEDPDKVYTVTFTNTETQFKWLSGNDFYPDTTNP